MGSALIAMTRVPTTLARPAEALVPPDHPHPAAQLLGGSDGPRPEDSAALLELVYDQLRSIAGAKLRDEADGGAAHTLQPTALVHEAYARLVGGNPIHWRGRGHFFALAAEAMRRILIEHARAKAARRRGGDRRSAPTRVPLNLLELAERGEPDEILSVSDALDRLETHDADLARLVRLRFFAGLSEQETAAALGVSDRTVRREWTVARAWLRRWLDQTAVASGPGPRPAEPPSERPRPAEPPP